jgi:hypothetical protein
VQPVQQVLTEWQVQQVQPVQQDQPVQQVLTE